MYCPHKMGQFSTRGAFSLAQCLGGHTLFAGAETTNLGAVAQRGSAVWPWRLATTKYAADREYTGKERRLGDMVVYLDILFFLNFGINYLLLRCVGRLGGKACFVPRLLLGAALGGVLAAVMFFAPPKGCGAFSSRPFAVFCSALPPSISLKPGKPCG